MSRRKTTDPSEIMMEATMEGFRQAKMAMEKIKLQQKTKP